MMLAMVVGSIGGGITNSKVGYYTPLAIIGSCIMAVGAGLLTTFQVDSGAGKWIGYQVVYGLGLGLCFQVPNLEAQPVLREPPAHGARCGGEPPDGQQGQHGTARRREQRLGPRRR